MKTGEEITVGTEKIRVLFGPEEIQTRVQDIGAALHQRLGRACPIFIGLLHGGFVFLSDLVRSFDADHEVDFLKVSRYDPRQKDPTAVRIMHDLRSNIRDRHVVVVEGIRARGTKIEYVERFLQLHRPKQIEYVAMVRPSGAGAAVPVHETGFTIGSEFVVGYGLDYHERHRNLNLIGVLEESRGKAVGTA